MYINTTSYVLTAATCITLNEKFSDFENLVSTIPLLFKNYSLVEVIYMLIRFNKSMFFP